MTASQWEGEGVTHTEQNRPRESKGGRVGGGGGRERNSGPNSFSA